ncbi:MAG: bifunctional glutamate N-acetyltransferase/amino-acid acetyltransferase ArgJ [Clostridiales bacterium]|nr:bifunctional glutamate N-acetyltransferase/amino-acid acetyltransferase ArgJ [Clostridiales bacterium]MCF8022430.1 bifunctional glutamate N-acetyltransferase/amino-acid acetyltransferase ArgJ [Clostridiales bacterium]
MYKTKDIKGGITAPEGFLASGVKCGCKNNKQDLALLYSQTPSNVAGVFTKNKVKAAPLVLTRKRVKNGTGRAVVINSGHANACTGERGMEDARYMTAETARNLNIPEMQVLVSSTGVIGKPVPTEKVIPGIAKAASKLNSNGGTDAAQSIITTDTTIKETALSIETNQGCFNIGGMAKGSGMIHPNMATMLGFITTDAAVSSHVLQSALDYAVERSFNMITIDGVTSTNDMVLVISNGAAGGNEIASEGDDFEVFKQALTEICTRLAVMVARDGEGATKLLEVKVTNARTENDARLAAREVTSSDLVKSAVFGKDANWGRIICAVGQSEAVFDPEKVDIYIGDEQVARDGGQIDFSEERAVELLSLDHVLILIDMKEGSSTAVSWGCDLTYDYVKINADYRT